MGEELLAYWLLAWRGLGEVQHNLPELNTESQNVRAGRYFENYLVQAHILQINRLRLRKMTRSRT